MLAFLALVTPTIIAIVALIFKKMKRTHSKNTDLLYEEISPVYERVGIAENESKEAFMPRVRLDAELQGESQHHSDGRTMFKDMLMK